MIMYHHVAYLLWFALEVFWITQLTRTSPRQHVSRLNNIFYCIFGICEEEYIVSVYNVRRLELSCVYLIYQKDIMKS